MCFSENFNRWCGIWRANTTPVNYVCLEKISIKGLLIWRAITTPVKYVSQEYPDQTISYLESDNDARRSRLTQKISNQRISYLKSDYDARELRLAKKNLLSKGFFIWRAITTPVKYVCLKIKLYRRTCYLESDYDARELRIFR